MLIKKIFLALLVLSVTSSCKKDHKFYSASENGHNDPQRMTREWKDDEIVPNMVKIKDIFKELYKVPDNIKLVNAAIFSETYTDESVLLKDLIFPETSRLAENPNFQEICSANQLEFLEFSGLFWEQLEILGDEELNQFVNDLNYDNRTDEWISLDLSEIPRVTVYYPYSDNWFLELEPEQITLVAAQEDTDEAEGEMGQPGEESMYYTMVMVNDDFADENPTHIIGINGAIPASVINSAFPPTGPIDIPNLPREIKQVYVGDVKCTKQYDTFISFTGNGGGSEIRFTRADGFMTVIDGQVQANVYKTDTRTIKRKKIKKKSWVDFSIPWDEDWEAGNFQQHLGIYEEDNRNSSTFSGSVSTTVRIDSNTTGTGSVGFTVNYKSDDAIITQTYYNRDVFFVMNRIDQGGGFHQNWPIRYWGSTVAFTLNDRTYF